MIQGEKINWKTLTKDIGGKYLVDRRSYLIMVPFLVVTSVLSSSTTSSNPAMLASSEIDRYLGLIIANLASIAICWAYLEAVDRILFRNKIHNPIKMHWVLLFGASLGFLKGYTTALFSWLVGSELDLALAISNRVLQTTILGVWTIPLVAAVTSIFYRFQAERQILLAETVEKNITSSMSPLSSRGEAEKLNEYLANAKVEISNLRSSSGSSNSGQLIALKLRDLVETGLRPISHKIWQENSKIAEPMSVAHLAKLALEKNPFPIGIIFVGLAIALLPINLTVFTTGEAMRRTLVMLVVNCSILFVAKRIPRNSNFGIWVIFVFACLLSTLASLVTADAVFGSVFGLNDMPIWIAFFLWLLQLSLFASVVSEVVTTRSEIRGRLVDSLGQSGLDSEVRATLSRIGNRDLAQYIHGNIQNKLLSFALKFDQENLSTEDVDRLLNEVELLFTTAISNYQATERASPDTQLAQLAQRWAGFATIELTNKIFASDFSHEATKTLVTVASEAVSNAVRHGFAQNITITVESGDSASGYFEVTALDDGLGPRSGKPGLGTELYDAAAGVNWSLNPGKNGGSELKVRLKK